MEANFWHQRWKEGKIDFHENDINPLLIAHFPRLRLTQSSRVFVPLCGKTHDISWFLNQGYKVVGAELSEQAIIVLFESLNIKPQVSSIERFKLYQAPNIDIFVGDIFNLTADILGQVDTIYDRAALVALPAAMRAQYTQHLVEITHSAKQLLICFDYDQSVMEGPPFSVVEQEVHQLYAAAYALTLLSSTPLIGGLKGKVAALQQVWLLQKSKAEC